MRTTTGKILSVEDDPDDSLLLDEAFKEIGYEANIKKVADGDVLFDYLGMIEPALYPSLIVLDNRLPKKPAIEVLNLLKANKNYKDIPVVIYTTLISPHNKELLLAAGAYACVQKGKLMQDVVEAAKWFKQIAEVKDTGKDNGST